MSEAATMMLRPTQTFATVDPVRRLGRLVTRTAVMIEVLNLLDRLARTDVAVMLSGETGTGKDLCARALHERSLRAAGPFVIFDCGAVAATLAESELFGHERGSFTGAVASYAGAFERAHGGTLFLDELGELPLDLQTRLLRVLESQRVRRVGGAQDRPADVRVVAATNRNLRREVASGRFRQDLYYRIAGAVVAIPPLRSRLGDLPLLASKLLDDLGHGHLTVSEGALAAMREHPWPGNVRELKNVLASAAAFTEGNTLDPSSLRLCTSAPEDTDLERLPLAGHALQQLERAAIKQTMALTRGNKVNAARVLEIAVSTLYEKLKKYELND